ncbi:hypothetical protein IJJ08_00880 [bacterium]|nr:hypothetical protein [bacterium]
MAREWKISEFLIEDPIDQENLRSDLAETYDDVDEVLRLGRLSPGEVANLTQERHDTRQNLNDLKELYYDSRLDLESAHDIAIRDVQLRELRRRLEVAYRQYSRMETTDLSPETKNKRLDAIKASLSKIHGELSQLIEDTRRQYLKTRAKTDDQQNAKNYVMRVSLQNMNRFRDEIEGIVGSLDNKLLDDLRDKAQSLKEKTDATLSGAPKSETSSPLDQTIPVSEENQQSQPEKLTPREKKEESEELEEEVEEKQEEKVEVEEEKPPFVPEKVKIKDKDGKERLLRPEELAWWQPGKTVECVGGWEKIGGVAEGGIDNGSHIFRLDSGTGQLILRTADVPDTDEQSEVDARFRPRVLGKIVEVQVLTSEWSEVKQDDYARRDEYTVVIRTADKHEYRFASTASEMSREQARAAYEKKEQERREAAQALDDERVEAMKGHEKEAAMAELLRIKEDLHRISEVATIALRDNGNNHLDERSFDSLHREIRRGVLARQLEDVTRKLSGDISEEKRDELAAMQAAIQKELAELNAIGLALEFGEIKDKDGQVTQQAREYQNYREALKGEIKVRSAQLERYAERANKKDGLKPHERYAFEEARKSLDEAIAVQLEYEAIDEYDRYQKQINEKGQETITYKDTDNKDITVDLRSSENGEILSLQGKLDELGDQIAAAQNYITQIEQSHNARYDKQTVKKVKECRELIEANNKKAKNIRELIRQKEEKARNLMTLRQIFYLQAHGRVEEEDAAGSEMGIAYDVTNGNNEFFSYALTVALGSSGIQEQLKGSQLNQDGLADILIGRMTQIHDEAERDSAHGSGIARAVNSLRAMDLSSTFIDKAYYGIAGNDGVFSNKLTSEMIMLSGVQLLQAKHKALEAMRYRAGDFGGESIDDQERERGQRLAEAEEKWAVADVGLIKEVMDAEQDYTTADKKHPAGYKITAETPVGYESMDQALARDENAQRGQKRRQEALDQAQEQLNSVRSNRREGLRPFRAEIERHRADVFTKYDRLISEWEKEKEALRKEVDSKQKEIQALLESKQRLEDERRRRLFALDQQAATVSSESLREIQDARAEVISEYTDGRTGKLDDINKQLQQKNQELTTLYPERLDISFTKWLAEKGESPLTAQELEILQPYLDSMAGANEAFRTQRKFIAKVQSTWLFTVVGSFSNNKMSLTAGTNDMRSFFGRLDQTSHLRPDGVSNPEVMKYDDLWNKNFGSGRFDAETQRYLGENGDLQRIVAMCVMELRNRRSKYWAGNSDLSQSDGVRKLVDEMFDTYCNTEGRETIGRMSKEQQEFDKQLVLIKIARDDLVRKYAVEAYGLWFTALKNKQWDKLTDSGVLAALTYGLVRGKNGSTLAMLDFIDLDEIVDEIQAHIDKYFPEESSEDKARYEKLQKDIYTEELIMRQAAANGNEAERLKAEARIGKLRRSIGDLGIRYDQMESLALLKTRIQRHRAVMEASHPYGTLQEQQESKARTLSEFQRIRRELEKRQEGRPGLMKRIWRSLIGSEDQPPVQETAKKWSYVYSEEEYTKMMRSVNPNITDEQLRSIIANAQAKGLVEGKSAEGDNGAGTTENYHASVEFRSTKPTNYAYKPRKLSHDVVTMDAYLNQPPEGRQAAADWADAHDAFGDIMAICSGPIDKGLIEDPDRLVEVINKINTNFSRIASIALDNSDANMALLPGSDVTYNYMREAAEAAYCGWIENVLRSVGGSRPTRWTDNGETIIDGQRYASKFKTVENAIRDALGKLGSNSRNKAIYNEKILLILDNNARFYIGPEQDLRGPNPYVRKANSFWNDELVHGRLTRYLKIVAGRIVGYEDASGTQFAEWDEENQLMKLTGELPKDVLEWMDSPPVE